MRRGILLTVAAALSACEAGEVGLPGALVAASASPALAPLAVGQSGVSLVAVGPKPYVCAAVAAATSDLSGPASISFVACDGSLAQTLSFAQDAIRSSTGLCLAATGDTGQVAPAVFTACVEGAAPQRWQLTGQQVTLGTSGRCLDRSANQTLSVAPCEPNATSQRFATSRFIARDPNAGH